jgi:ATP-binding cassette subfamily B protein
MCRSAVRWAQLDRSPRRFSTVRAADLIVVLEAGQAGESGSHDELMRAGGTYAELFELQARAYR